jgi:hypothetical protein
MMTRSHFEHTSGRITTIAPTPHFRVRTLAEAGWQFITRDMAGNILSIRNADEVKAEMRRKMGHREMPMVPLGFASCDPATGITTIRTQ